MATLMEVPLPDMGNDDKKIEAVVSFWPVAVGDCLAAGDDLLEVVTDKANFVVACPRAGLLREQRVREDDRVRVGDVVAVIETV